MMLTALVNLYIAPVYQVLCEAPVKRQAKTFVKFTTDRLQYDTRFLAGIFSGQCRLNWHIFNLRLVEEATCHSA